MTSSSLEHLLLRAALLDGDAALLAWAEARRQPGCIDQAPYRILPQLYRNLVELGVDDPDMERLKGVYRHAWSSNQRELVGAASVLGALCSAGIETLVLGGIPHGGPPVPIERLDVMVRAAAREDSLRVLRAAGWQAAHPDLLDWHLQVGSGVVLKLPPADHMGLHTNPFWEPVAAEPIWERARRSELRGVETLAPDPAHELMRACTGGLPVPPAPARWIPEAVSVIRTSGESIDWELLADCAERWRMTARLETALEILRTEFREPVPPRTLERLRRARRPLHERAAHYIGRRRPPRGSHHVLQWHRHRGLRAVDPVAAGRFPGYWRGSLGEDTWGAVAGRYARRLKRTRPR